MAESVSKMSKDTQQESTAEVPKDPRMAIADTPWDELPLKPIAYPNRHFQSEPVPRDQLTPEQYDALLATPRGYRWMKEPTASLAAPEPCPVVTRMASNNMNRLIHPPEQKYAHEFLSHVIKALSSKNTREMLTTEFGLSQEEADQFVKDRTSKKKAGYILNLNARADWLNEYRRIMRAKLIDYIATVMSTRRSRRTRYIAGILLNHLCDLTGEYCNLNNPQNRVQRIQVYVADRFAAWLANVMADTDKELCKEYLEKSATKDDSDAEEKKKAERTKRTKKGEDGKKEARKKKSREEREKKQGEAKRSEDRRKKMEKEKKGEPKELKSKSPAKNRSNKQENEMLQEKKKQKPQAKGGKGDSGQGKGRPKGAMKKEDTQKVKKISQVKPKKYDKEMPKKTEKKEVRPRDKGPVPSKKQEGKETEKQKREKEKEEEDEQITNEEKEGENEKNKGTKEAIKKADKTQPKDKKEEVKRMKKEDEKGKESKNMKEKAPAQSKKVGEQKKKDDGRKKTSEQIKKKTAVSGKSDSKAKAEERQKKDKYSGVGKGETESGKSKKKDVGKKKIIEKEKAEKRKEIEAERIEGEDPDQRQVITEEDKDKIGITTKEDPEKTQIVKQEEAEKVEKIEEEDLDERKGIEEAEKIKAAEKEETEKIMAAEKEDAEKIKAAEKEEAEKIKAAEKEEAEKIKASEKEDTEKIKAAEDAEKKKAAEKEEADIKTVLTDDESAAEQDKEKTPVEGAGDVSAGKDRFNAVSHWVDHQQQPQKKSKRIEDISIILKNDVRAEMARKLTIEEETALDRTADKYAQWIDTVLEEAEATRQAFIQSKVTYHIKRLKGNCYYDVVKIRDKQVCDLTKMSRTEKTVLISDSICKRPANDIPLASSKELKEWARWAADVVDLAEKWAAWIDRTCNEAEAIAMAQSLKKESEHDLENFKKSTKSDALELRRNKKYIRETADIWNKKIRRQ